MRALVAAARPEDEAVDSRPDRSAGAADAGQSLCEAGSSSATHLAVGSPTSARSGATSTRTPLKAVLGRANTPLRTILDVKQATSAARRVISSFNIGSTSDFRARRTRATNAPVPSLWSDHAAPANLTATPWPQSAAKARPQNLGA